jgi:hypothetical protein
MVDAFLKNVQIESLSSTENKEGKEAAQLLLSYLSNARTAMLSSGMLPITDSIRTKII